jgi:tetratricopeptide (TPR) repeat protein
MRLNRVNRDKDPDNVDALNRKGCLFVKMKQYKEAIEVYDMAISINSKKANVYHNKGIALKHLNRNKEALQYLKLATDLGEHCILSFTAKGEVEQLLGRGPEALASFKQAKRLLGDPLATKGLSEGNMEYIKKSL